MTRLAVTVIDVGWGDSILLEATDLAGDSHFALIDCNDYENERSALVFVKRFFQRRFVAYESNRNNFDWVLLTHGHADHARGLKRMLQTFGTKQLWYPKSVPSTSYGNLIRYANRSTRVEHHQAIDRTKVLPAFGEVGLEVLWPDHDQIDATNENNNSIVLALTRGNVSIVLTGDAEAENWDRILPRLPATTRVLQAPHHGARNGAFDAHDATPWITHLGPSVSVVMSSHLRPHGHPHPEVIDELVNAHIQHYRTDRHFHVTCETDGNHVTFRYTR